MLILFECNLKFLLKMSTATSHCDGNPCQNGGLCTDTGDDFQCSCQNGFSGRICQLGKTFYKIYHRFLFIDALCFLCFIISLT